MSAFVIPARPRHVRRSAAAPLWAVALLTLAFAAFVLTWQIGMWRTDEVRPAASDVGPPPAPLLLDQRVRPISPETAVQVNAARPIVTDTLVSAAPFRFAGSAEMLERATDCLAAASWYEAGDDPTGQRAVMQVILNRARHPSFPPSVCGVVFEGSSRKTGCQFTFTCDGAITNRTPSAAAWKRARALATAALGGVVDPRVGYSAFYHANYVVPYWADSFDKIAQVGLHLFYRWQGFWGTKGAFRQKAGADEPAIPAMARFAAASDSPDGVPAPAIDPAAASDLGSSSPDLTAAPIAVDGVREKSLRGAMVRGQAPDQFFLQLDPSTFPGNYATAAVALCKGKPTCTVLGWREGARMGASLPLTDAQRSALSFYFTQGSDASFKALWNCQQMPRKNPTQCLPTGLLPGLN